VFLLGALPNKYAGAQKYICSRYTTADELNNLKDAFGASSVTDDEWAAIQEPRHKCGAMAAYLVNRPMGAYSLFTYTDAAMYGIGSLVVSTANQASTEWFLAEAIDLY